MLRLFFVSLFMILFFTVGQIGLFVGFVIKIFNKDLSDKFYMNYVKSVFRVIIFLSGVKVEVYGIENIEMCLNKDSAKLIVSNHRSFFDIIVGYTFFKYKTGIIAKVELKKIPILNVWMKKIYCLFLDRKDMKQSMKTIVSAIKNVENNISMWIFPEGTRNKNENSEDLLDFKEGSFSIAKKTNCEILPIAFLNTDYVFEKQKPFLRATKVKVYIGKSFNINSLNDEDKDNVGLYTQNIIKNMIIEMKK